MAAARLDRAAGPRLHTRALRPGRLRAAFPAGARIRGCVTRCSTCRSIRCSSCGWGSCRPATTRRSSRRTSCHRPTATCACPRGRGGWCGSWTTGRRRSRGPRTSSRSSCPTAASSIRCRWTAVRSPTRATRSCVTADRRDDLLVLLATALAVAVLLLRERVIAGAAGFPLDDSWIHLHFARNLAAGAGFSYNPGVPIAGSTAPLWTLLLGAGAVVASTSLAMAKGVGIVATVGAALVTRRAALAWAVRRDVALIASIALLWMGPIVWGALSGMEVSLAALLVAAALLAHAHDRPLASAVWVALAVLARPEALLLVPFVAAARPLTLRRVAVFAVVTTVVVAPAILFSLATAGTPYPATAAANVEGGLVGWLGGVREPAALTWIRRPLAFFTEWIVWLATTHWLLPIALVPAFILAWRRAGRALGLVVLAPIG